MKKIDSASEASLSSVILLHAKRGGGRSLTPKESNMAGGLFRPLAQVAPSRSVGFLMRSLSKMAEEAKIAWI